MTTGEETDQKSATQTNVVVLAPAAEPQGNIDRASAFVRRHPVLTIAGGLAAGAVAAALIPRRNRAYITKQSSLLGEAIAAAGATIAQQALASLDSASTTVRDSAHSIALRAEHVGEAAYGRARAIVTRKPAPPPSLGERIAAHASDLANKLRR